MSSSFNGVLIFLGAQLFKSSDKKYTVFLVFMMKKKVYNFIEPVIFLKNCPSYCHTAAFHFPVPC